MGALDAVVARLVRPALLAGLVVASACAGPGHRSSPLPGTGSADSAGGAVVVRVVDGDTLRVRVLGHDERVRLIGIDTPETVKPDTPVQCFGPEASRRAKSLLPPGSRVRLVRDVEPRDRYGRLLAYVYRASDGLFVNLALVREGFAVPYTFPPNVAHARELVAAAASARQSGRGLWGRCPAAQVPRHATELDAARPP